MTAVFAIALAMGVVGLIAWIASSAAASMVEGWESIDPDLIFGGTGRAVVAFLVGFGMAGMSASFGGLAPFVSVLAAGVGGFALVALSIWFGPAEPDQMVESDPES